jgi:hypothetical protein
MVRARITRSISSWVYRGAVYRREQEAEIWVLTDRRTREAAEKPGHSLGELSAHKTI